MSSSAFFELALETLDPLRNAVEQLAEHARRRAVVLSHEPGTFAGFLDDLAGLLRMVGHSLMLACVGR